MGNSDATDKELVITFTGAEALVNSRPLTYYSANPQDDISLIPNHLLHGQIEGIFTPETTREAYHDGKKFKNLPDIFRNNGSKNGYQV